MHQQQTTSYRYGWYTAAVLMVCYTFSFLDRQILTLMVGPIKADLHITDTQFALLTGGAFGIFYTVMGIPIGWLVDRYPRIRIVSGGIALWSLMTAACGLMMSFPGLLMGRVGVGVGEATLSPSAYSILSDHFDRTRLPRAMSLYSVGIYFGAGLALILGGSVVSAIARSPDMVLPVVGHLRSWHAVFFAVGLPGLLVAAWVATLREPVRGGVARAATRSGFSPAPVWAFLSANSRMSAALFLGSAIAAIMSYMDSWFPELFIRTWGWSPAKVGGVNGAASLIAGPLGMIAAGYLSSRMLDRGRTDACLRLSIVAALGMGLVGCVMPLSPDATVMAACLFPYKFLGGFAPVLIPTAIQMIAPPALRGQLGAVFMLTVGIIGVTLGPVLPAFLSDYVLHDERRLYLSLSMTAAVVGPVAAILYVAGMSEFRRRLAAIAVDDDT